MGFAVVFFAFSLLFFWLGGAFWGSGVLAAPLVSLGFYQAALAEFFTGALYLVNSLFLINAGGLFKTPKGRINLLPRLLAWPYLVFEYWGWRRYRETGREPLFEEVREGLFLGARIIDDDLPALRKAGITAVLDMVAEFEAPDELRADPRIAYVALPVLDGTTPSLAEIEMGARFLTETMAAGRKALVHCTFGHGRSAMLAAAALIRIHDADGPEGALEILGRLERRIWLTRSQKRALAKFSRGTL
jgi:hypothetical protein